MLAARFWSTLLVANMAYFRITGGRELSGEIAVTGAKNAALKFIAAALVIDGEVKLENVPDIEDVRRMLKLLESLGARVEHQVVAHEVLLDCRSITSSEITNDLARSLRTSIMVVGPLLARFGEVKIGYPGGCVIGRRPIDLYLRGYKQFGATIDSAGDVFTFTTKQLQPTTFVFPIISHVATEAFMLTAARLPGKTILKNTAQEPEVVALAEFLNACGAKIIGAGTNTIIIEGVAKLNGGTARLIPDRIEAGTMVLLGALTKSAIKITHCEPAHLENLLAHLELVGAPFKVGADWIATEKYNHQLTAMNVKTHEYPGFVTDLQAPFTVLMTQAEGLSLIHETIWEGRMFYTDLLNRMGANIILCDPHRALVQGNTPLRGKRLESPDIRAGIAMVMAGLIAAGETIIDNITQIDRGYEQIDARLRALNADIIREE